VVAEHAFRRHVEALRAGDLCPLFHGLLATAARRRAVRVSRAHVDLTDASRNPVTHFKSQLGGDAGRPSRQPEDQPDRTDHARDNMTVSSR